MSVCLHRAKRTKDGEWVQGYYYRISDHTEPFIMLQNKNSYSVEVDEKTVSRCLNIPCNNADKLWENDILLTTFDDGEYICIVKFLEDKGQFVLSVPCENDYLYNIDVEELKHYDLVGNIFDNPEIIKVNTSLDNGKYEVIREINTKAYKNNNVTIAYHTSIVIEGNTAIAANKIRFPKDILKTFERYLRKIN